MRKTDGNSGNKAGNMTSSHLTSPSSPKKAKFRADATRESTESTSFGDVDGKAKPETKKAEQARLGAPPDGGWGWVVALSSFSISLLVDGVCFSFGIFFDDFRSEFKATKATTSWIGSVLNGSYLIFGPIVGALVNIYGCRRVAMCGAVLACVAFFCSAYSHNIGMLIFTFGFLGGIGFGLMYLPAIVIVGYYFERRRALATGIACCGSGMGAFLFAPFSEYLLNNYGWRGATWIISGLVLHGFMFALFYRPLPGPTIERVVSNVTTTAGSQSDTLLFETELEAELSLSKGESREILKKGQEVNVKPVGSDILNKVKEDVLAPTSTGLYRTRSVNIYGTENLRDKDTSFKSTDTVRLTRSQDLSPMKIGGTSVAKLELAQKRPEGKTLELPPLQRKDIFYSGSIWHLKEYKELGSMDKFRHEMISQTPSAVTQATPSSGIPRRESSTGQLITQTVTVSVSRPSMREAIESIFDIHLLKSPTFLVYGFSCFLCMAGFFVPFTYMPDHAIGLGLDTQSAAFLISIIGITNTVGRVAVGFISDQPWADCLLINNVALMIGGLATIFVPYYWDYYVLAIYSAVFGSAIAVFVSLRSIIMVELLGLEKLTTAFGFVIMFQGFSSLVGSPIAGALSDLTGDYNAAFYMAGITLFLSGVVCLPLKHVARWESARAAELSKNGKDRKRKGHNKNENNSDHVNKSDSFGDDNYQTEQKKPSVANGKRCDNSYRAQENNNREKTKESGEEPESVPMLN